jgi:hypothetical protein
MALPINDVAKVTGHEQASTTLDPYAHLTKDRDGGNGRRSPFAAFDLYATAETAQDSSGKGPDVGFPSVGVGGT